MGRNWTPQQKNAIYSTDGSVLVSAAAGSGKTSVLVERVIQMVTRQNNPVDVDKLLIVTFTKAAANEMKERIMAALDSKLKNDPYNPALLRQKQLLYSAQISTIDSFCGNLVRDYFHVLNVNRDYRIGDNGEVKVMEKQALDDTMEYFYKNGNSDFTELLAAFSSKQGDADLRKSIEKISEFLSTQPFPEKWLDKMLKNYETTSVSDSVFGRIIMDNAVTSTEHAIQLNQKAFELLKTEPILEESNSELFASDAKFINTLSDLLQHGTWTQVYKHLKTFNSGRLSARKLPKDHPVKLQVSSIRNSFKAIIADIKKLFLFNEDEVLEQFSQLHSIVSVLFDMVRDYIKRLNELKTKKNIMTFSDVELLTVKLLATPDDDGYTKTEYAKEIAKRFDYVIVDEFQDVNDVQDLIFKCVSRDESNLFVVGDVKQSIYSFRQTRPEIFIKRKDSYNMYDENNPVYPAAIILDKNFRSRDGICKAVNYIFSRLMTKRVAQMDYTADEYLNTGAEYPPTNDCAFEFSVLEKMSFSEDISAIELEARYIAERIRQMMNDNYQIKDGDKTRKVTYGDFAVILRKTKDTAPVYVKILNDCGIPAYSETKENALEAVEIKIIMNYLRIIDNPTLEIPLLSVMCSPAYGFTADELAQIKAESRHSNLYNSVKAFTQTDKKAKKFIDDLDNLRIYAYTGSVDNLLGRVYEITSYESVTSAVKGGENPTRNLEMLRNYARQFEANGYKTLSDFIGYVDKLVENGVKLDNISTDSDSLNAVRVLSVHSSKGLEYPVCFLSGTEKKFNEEEKKDNVMLDSKAGIGIKKKVGITRCNTLPRLAVEIETSQNQLAEEMRILYVALTRAKEKLIVISAIKDIEKNIQKALSNIVSNDRIDPYVASQCKSISDWIMLAVLTHPECNALKNRYSSLPSSFYDDDTPQMKFNIVESLETAPSSDNNTSKKENIFVESSIDYGEILRKNLSFKYRNEKLINLPQKVTASEIAHNENSDYFNKVLQKPAFLDDKRSATDRGTAHHKFLQFRNFIEARDDIDAEIDSLVSEGKLTSVQAELIDRQQLLQMLTSPLFDRVVKSNNVMREEKFFAKIHPSLIFDDCKELADDVNIIIQGAVDLAFEENGEIVIVDYKTDRLNNIDKLKMLYTKQLELYKAAIEQYTSKNVKSCVLYSLYLNDYVVI